MSYVELPVNILYKFDLPFGKVFGGAGAAFSYAVGGREQQGDVTRKIYGGAVKDWKREDVSLTFTAGLEFNNGFFASVNSQKGLMNIHQADGVSVKNKSVSVSVGYLLDRKKFKQDYKCGRSFFGLTWPWRRRWYGPRPTRSAWGSLHIFRTINFSFGNG